MQSFWTRLTISLIVLFCLIPVSTAFCQTSDSRDLLREGLLGAGAGAVGGAASGAKGSNVWKGALAGAGVNIVGGALLDSLSGEKVSSVEDVDSSTPRDAYGEGYQDGYNNGYKTGYTDGYKDGVRDAHGKD
ncbi:MAG: hypothetical protein PHW14_03065 [Candidatus Omnitrophica bacterium]|nr:hypothetical protein [Candidatus Omnitrophota bacterium]